MQSMETRRQLRQVNYHLKQASQYMRGLRETCPDFVDDLHPTLLILTENCEAEIKNIYDYPEGQTYQVTSVFKEWVFARSEDEARALHLRLLTQWGREGNLEGNPMQDVEEVEATEAECYISFKEPAHA